MDIDDWRRQIDDVDLRILNLLNQRAQHSIEIGRIKNKKHKPIYSPEREAFIIKRIIHENTGPLSKDAVCRIFERIIDESRKLEKDIIKNNPKED